MSLLWPTMGLFNWVQGWIIHNMRGLRRQETYKRGEDQPGYEAFLPFFLSLSLFSFFSLFFFLFLSLLGIFLTHKAPPPLDKMGGIYRWRSRGMKWRGR